MRKKLLAWVLIAIMIVSMMPAAAAAAGYEDTEGHWAESSIDRWSEYGIVQGNNGQFDPNGELTRGQLAAIIARLLNLPEAEDAGFGDTDGHWAEDVINRCAAAGIMKGDGVNARPDDHITREETMVMLGRALGIKPVEDVDLSDYDDAHTVSSWAAGYVAAMTESGIVNGIAGSLAPDADINRASTMTILDRAITTYVTEPGAEVEATGGIVVIAAENVTVTGEAAAVVVTEAAASSTTTLDSVSVDTVIVQATESSVVVGSDTVIAEVTVTEQASGSAVEVTETATVGSVTTNASESSVAVSGTVETIAVAETASGAAVEVTETASVTTVSTDAAESTVAVSGTVETVTVTETASSASVAVTESASVGTVTTDAAESSVAVSGTVQTVTVTENATGTIVETEQSAQIENVETQAEGTTVTGSGTVSNVTTSGNNTTVETEGTKVEAQEGTTGTTAGGEEVAGGESTTTETITPEEPETENPEESDTPVTPSIPVHYCVVVSTVVTAPTCTEQGYTTYTTCCGYSYTRNYEDALDHDFTGDYTSDETGHWHICAREGCTVTDTKVAHVGLGTVCDVATSCTACGYVKAAGQHIWNDGVVTTAPTCSATGVKTFACTVEGCDGTKTEEIAIDADAHSWGEWTGDHYGSHTRECALNSEHTETGACSDTPCTVCGDETVYVASHSNGKRYASLADALAIDGTVVLLSDVTLGTGEYLTVAAEKTITIDFNGSQIFKTDKTPDVAPLEVYGNLTLKDTSESKDGGIAGYKRAVNTYGTSKLTIDSGIYSTTDKSGGAVVRAKDSSEVVINGGTFNAANIALSAYGTTTLNGGTFNSISCHLCGNYGYTVISQGASAVLTVNIGVTINAHHGALCVAAGTATINGGTFNVVDRCAEHDSGMHYALYIAGETEVVSCEVKGGTFTSAGYKTVVVGNSGDGGEKKDAYVTITGGTFKNTAGNVVVESDADLGNPSIKGGTFDTDPSAYVAAGYYATKANEVWSVKAVNKENVTSVEELRAALAMGGKIVVNGTMNPDEAIVVSEWGQSKMEIYVDAAKVNSLKGGTYVLDEGAKYGVVATAVEGQSVTLSEMDITANSQWSMLIDNYGDKIVVEDVTITAKSGAGLYAYGLSSSTTTLNNVKINHEKLDPTYEADTPWAATAIAVSSGHTMVINSGVYVGSTWAVYGYNSGSTVTINGGTFKAERVIQMDGVWSGSNKNVATINGGNFDGAVYLDWGTNVPEIYINDGTFTNFSATVCGQAKLVITGGTFDADPSAYVAEGYEAFASEDGKTWTVGKQVIDTEAELADAIAKGGTVTLGGDITVTKTIEVAKNVTIALNGKALNSNVSEGRALKITADNVNLTINATGSESTFGNGTYGIVEIGDGSGTAVSNASVTINGGTFEGTTNYGGFVKIRDNVSGSVTLTNVTYTDNCKLNGAPNANTNAWVINTSGHKVGEVTLKVIGGTYSAVGGFSTNELINATFDGVTVNVTGAGFETKNTVIKNCEITLDPGAYLYSADGAAIATSGGGTVTVSNTKITTTSTSEVNACLVVFPTGGTINALGCTLNGAQCYVYDNATEPCYIYVDEELLASAGVPATAEVE